MKGIIMGLFYLFSGIGSFLGTAIIATLSSANVWFHSHDYGNINCRLPCKPGDEFVLQSCHQDFYFYLLAGIEVLGAFLFLLVARAFHLDEHHRHSRSMHQLAETSGDFLDPADTQQNQQQQQHPPRHGRGQRHSIQRHASEEAAFS